MDACLCVFVFSSESRWIENGVEATAEPGGNDLRRRSEVRVVSFDLDNTLWRTSCTIDAANDALALFLSGMVNSTISSSQPPIRRVEQVMGDLFCDNKARYCPVDADKQKSPVSLTRLRKDAILQVLKQQQHQQQDDDNDTIAAACMDELIVLADTAFAEWTRARHEAIPSHLAVGVEECLRQIASLRTSQGHPVLIGAITDGNSDPRNIPALSPYFDFCVQAETVGVGKPDKRVRAYSVVIRPRSLYALAFSVYVCIYAALFFCILCGRYSWKRSNRLHLTQR
jgi:FMN phosphatase YigB (HAD superfamily)